MKKETVAIAVFALIAGLLGGILISMLAKDKSAPAQNAAIPAGSGSPTDYVRRIAEAEKIVAQDPKNLNAWISLGNDYFDTDQPQKSIQAYGKALEIDPNNPNILTDQGVMFRKMGWYDKAIANFEKAQQIDPKHLQSLFNMGIVYAMDLKQPDKAAKVWKRYLQLDPDSPTAIEIKGMLQKIGAGGTAPAAK